MGDLSELKNSISEQGIIQPLIVRQRGDRFQIIAGERRYQAAVQLGREEVPVVIRDTNDEREVLELALIENIQRKDLTAFEESEALGILADKHGYTHEQLSKRLGKSRTTITESLALNGMSEEVKNRCRLADITSKSLLLEIVRQPDKGKMIEVLGRIAAGGKTTRELLRREKEKPKAGRPKAYVYQYKDPGKKFNVKLNFSKARVNRSELISALEAILRNLKESGD
tara:strand:- start:49 stop:729 length:681 start_codon:yes stop_codon:yes gene_type:complete